MLRIIKPLPIIVMIIAQNIIPSIAGDVIPQGNHLEDTSKIIKQKINNGLDAGRNAIERYYKNKGESLENRKKEIQELTKRKSDLQTIQKKILVEINKKTREYADNPSMLTAMKRYYMGKMNEIKHETEYIEAYIPKLKMELSEDTLELEVENMMQKAPEKNKDDNFNKEYEKAVEERFQKNIKLLQAKNFYQHK